MKKGKWIRTMAALCLACAMAVISVPGTIFVQASEVQMKEDKESNLADFTLRKSPKEEKYFWDDGEYHDGNILIYNKGTMSFDSYDDAVQSLGAYMRHICSLRYEDDKYYRIEIPISIKSEKIDGFIDNRGNHDAIGQKVYDVMIHPTLDPEESMILEEHVRNRISGMQDVKYVNGCYIGKFYLKAKRQHTYDEYRVFQQKAKEILEEANLDNKSDVQKLHALYTWFWDYKNIVYRSTGNYVIKEDGSKVQVTDDQSAYSALVEGGAVCGGMTQLLHYLCLSAGLKAYHMSGTNVSNAKELIDSGKYYEDTVNYDIRAAQGTSHAWNFVELDGKYYQIDTSATTYSKNDDDFLFGRCGQKDSFEYEGKRYPTTAISTINGDMFGDLTSEVLSHSSKEDYNLEYLDCKHGSTELRNQKDATLTEEGYTGDVYCTVCKERIKAGTVTPKEEFTVVLANDTYEYTGKDIIPSVSVSYKDRSLTLGKDYSISYVNNCNAGTATVTITGIGEYEGGLAQRTFTINAADISQKEIQIPDDHYVFNGKEIKPEVTINGLEENVDYTVEYENNVGAGTAYVVVNGLGNYKGSVRKEFAIDRANIADKDAVLSSDTFEYTGGEIKPLVTIEGLQEGIDYSVDYSNNVEIGNATVTVTGKGNYEGTNELHFTITQKQLDENEWHITLSGDTFTYTGDKIEPTVTVEGFSQGKDYTVEYRDNINVGTATVLIKGMGNYQGELSKTFQINPQSIVDREVSYDDQAVYTGKEICPEVTVEGLTDGVDYTVTYSDNLHAGIGTITITGVNNYFGTVEKNFTITPAAIKADDVHLAETNFVYTGNQIKPEVTIEGLTEVVDYLVAYKNNIDAGTATVVITGKNDYVGTVEKSFVIEKADISGRKLTFTAGTNVFEFNGSAVCPEVTVEGLKNTDYTVEYENNTGIGEANVKVTGTGNYTGELTASFTIVQKIININTLDISVTSDSMVYTGKELQPEITIEGLVKDLDYTVEYSDNVNVGQATVIVKGIGAYTGTVEKQFRITPADLSKMTATVDGHYTFTGSAIKPEVTVEGVNSSDYEVSYQKNVHAGTAVVTLMGTGNYTGMLQTEFTIEPKALTSEDLVLDKETWEYTGAEICPEVSMSISNADYEITACSYENNRTIGKASVTVTCIGDLQGTATKEFSITQADIQNVITGISVDSNGFASKGNSFYYTGSEIRPRLELSGLTEGIDYVISYKNNVNVGTASIVASGKGVYNGSYEYNFEIIPATSGDSNLDQGTSNGGINHSGSTGSTGSSSAQPQIKVRSIKINGLSTKVAAGKTVKLGAEVLPENAANKGIKWVSSNPKVATVSQSGLVKVNKKAAGKSVTITAIAADGGARATYKIKAMKGIVKKVTISGAKTVKAGKSLKAKAKMLATKGANKKLLWTSSNENYATVKNGKIKTSKLAKGKKVKITVMATDGSGKKAVLNIKIK